MKEAFIVDIIRTPVGKYGGALSRIRPDDLAALVLRQIVERNSDVDTREIEDVVLGAALQDPGHSVYGNTTAIITKLAALIADTVVWGYIDCGVTTGNYTLAEHQTQINEWIDIGAGGIFCDVIGYAYGVSRTRQNAIIDYIHSKGVGAILNVFNPDEVFSSAVDPVYNPGGTATHANSSDVHLLESWVANTDS